LAPTKKAWWPWSGRDRDGGEYGNVKMKPRGYEMITKDILLVDDDIESLHFLSMLLESEGFNVSTTSSGIKALETLKHNEFRMMITDFNMPEINGVDLALKVREQHSDMHVVLATGSDFSDVVEEAAKAGISEILSKPLDLRRLLEVIRCSLPAR